MFKSFQPDTRLIIAVIFSMGVVTFIALLLGALIAAAYLLNLAVSAITELVIHIASVYSHSDSLMQFFILFLLGYLVYQVGRHVWHKQGGTL